MNLFFDLIAKIVRAFILRYQDCTINYIYIDEKTRIVGKSRDLLFFELINLIVLAFIVRYQDCTINYIYINIKKSVYFLDIKM